MALTPNALNALIGDLERGGMTHKKAALVAYASMRIDWRKKYPTVKFPSWLEIETRGKNPVKARKKSIGKLNDYFTVTPNTTEILAHGKKYHIYGAYPTLKIADSYAKKYKKSGQGTSVVRDLTAKAGRLRYALFVTDSFTERFYAKKNPVQKKSSKRRKSAKKNPVTSYIKVFRHGHGGKEFTKKGYFTGTGWNTEMSKGKQYSAGEAKKVAEQLKIPTGWGLAIVSG